ncbi:restriction endonuclease [Streptomyces sp. NBC_00510]
MFHQADTTAEEETSDSGTRPDTPPAPRPVPDWQAAEHNALAWVRWLGFPQAEPTRDGSDGGLDIAGPGIYGQVKFHGKAVPPNLVQQLFGARGLNSGEMLFFANSGYTAAAIAAADRLDVGCFTYSPADGMIEPANRYAAELMERAISPEAEDEREVRAEEERQKKEKKKQKKLAKKRKKIQRSAEAGEVVMGEVAGKVATIAAVADPGLSSDERRKLLADLDKEQLDLLVACLLIRDGFNPSRSRTIMADGFQGVTAYWAEHPDIEVLESESGEKFEPLSVTCLTASIGQEEALRELSELFDEGLWTELHTHDGVVVPMAGGWLAPGAPMPHFKVEVDATRLRFTGKTDYTTVDLSVYANRLMVTTLPLDSTTRARIARQQHVFLVDLDVLDHWCREGLSLITEYKSAPSPGTKAVGRITGFEFKALPADSSWHLALGARQIVAAELDEDSFGQYLCALLIRDGFMVMSHQSGSSRGVFTVQLPESASAGELLGVVSYSKSYGMGRTDMADPERVDEAARDHIAEMPDLSDSLSGVGGILSLWMHVADSAIPSHLHDEVGMPEGVMLLEAGGLAAWGEMRLQVTVDVIGDGKGKIDLQLVPVA